MFPPARQVRVEPLVGLGGFTSFEIGLGDASGCRCGTRGAVAGYLARLVGRVGGAAGILLAMLSLRLILRMMPDAAGIVSREIFRLDGTMMAVAIGLALLAGLGAGIYPAWRASRISPAMQINVT